MVPRTEIAIIGGGLAGLYAARLLQAGGIDFRVFEARERLGGRILTTDTTGAPSDDGFDLGASWFWPRPQPALARLAEKLGIATFPQGFQGDAVIERMSRETPQRYRPVENEPQSMRIVGGTGALVTALTRELPADRIHRGSRVTAMAIDGDGVVLSVERADGSSFVTTATSAIAAVPPRLLEGSVSFTPTLDQDVAERWRATGTWMAPHAKFFAFYDRPFWREAGLSGTAQSFVGPLAEIHDATTSSGHAALLGFFGVGADQRRSLGDAALSAACVGQLVRIFGRDAGAPRATLIKDWAADDLTSTSLDRSGGSHPVPTEAPWVTGQWQGRLWLAASETSTHEPGFMAGALTAAERAASACIRQVAPSW